MAKYEPGTTVDIYSTGVNMFDVYIVENIILQDHYSTLTALFSDIATVIREKTGDTASIIADNFPSVIRESLQIAPPKPYITFKSPSSFTLKVNDATKHWDGTLEYSTDASTWSTWDGTTTLSSVDSGNENVLYLRGTGNTVITGKGSDCRWVLTGTDIACLGNIETLLDYATAEAGNHPTMATNCYISMFWNCTSLTQAPALPATMLATDCYNSMFYNCTNLTKAPALPATTLAEYCYNCMFQNCTSLTQAPTLSATTLKNYCYAGMFRGCTSLTKAPALPATTLAEACYNSMFKGCTNLTQAPALSATTLTYRCYSEMFYNCTSLTAAPALPATTLASYCYQYMFDGCTSLTQAPTLPATTLKNYCYQYMFRGCTKIKVSSTQTGEYTIAYRIPTTETGTTATSALSNMFSSTGGTFTGTPEINTTYYLSNTNTVIYPPITLISFTIRQVTYQAEKGMTFGEWVNSSYNPGEFYINESGLLDVHSDTYIISGVNKSSDIIVDNMTIQTMIK